MYKQTIKQGKSIMKLFHATYQTYIESILENGLLPNPPHRNWDDSDLQPGVYLGIDPDQAISYAECAEDTPDEVLDSGIILIEIELPENAVQVDPNNQCGDTLIYNGVIKEFSKILTEKEYYESIHGK